MTSCLWCETTAGVTFDLYVPIVDETTEIHVCQEHLSNLRESEGRGDCANCRTFRDHEFPERNVFGTDCAPFCLCRDCYEPVKDEVRRTIRP